MMRICVLLLFLQAISPANGQSAQQGREAFTAGRIQEAERIFQAIPENHPEYATGRYYLGRIAHQQKDFEKALDYFIEATEANSLEGEYFTWLGDTYATIGATASVFRQMSVGPKALRSWETAAKLDPKNISARQSLASNYLLAPAFMGGGEEKARAVAREALVLLDDALKSNPEHHLHQYWYGKLAALTGLNLSEGAFCLQKYISHTPTGDEPSLAVANMRLGQIEEKQGKKSEARKNFEIALKLDPKLKGAREGLERTSPEK